MKIDIFSDPICPWCFIGHRRLQSALELRPDIEADRIWRPFQLNPDMPEDGMDRAVYLATKFGGVERARAVYEAIERAGETVGISFRFDRIKKTPNTIDAHRLIAYAQERDRNAAMKLVVALFESYFLEGVDIGKRDELVAIAERYGFERNAVRAYLEGDEFTSEVRAADNMSRRMGVRGVPLFLVEGKYALAGAHEAEAFLPLFDMALEEMRQSGISTPR